MSGSECNNNPIDAGKAIPPLDPSGSDTQRMNWMINNPFMSDVRFMVGGQLIYGHRLMLNTSSEVIQSLLKSNPPDDSGSDQPIEILDVQPDIFLLLLEFIYCNSCELTKDNLVDVQQAATSYQLQNLIKECELFWFRIDDYDTDSTMDVFFTSIQKNCPSMTERCMERICMDGEAVMKHSRLQEVPIAFMEKLIQTDRLRCTDQNLLDAIDRWRVHQPDEVAEDISRIRGIVTARMNDCNFQREYGGQRLDCRNSAHEYPIPYFKGVVYAKRDVRLQGLSVYAGLDNAECPPGVQVLAELKLFTDQDAYPMQTYQLVLCDNPYKLHNCFFNQIILRKGESCDLKVALREQPYTPNLFWRGLMQKRLRTVDESALQVMCEDNKVYVSPVAHFIYKCLD